MLARLKVLFCLCYGADMTSDTIGHSIWLADVVKDKQTLYTPKSYGVFSGAFFVATFGAAFGIVPLGRVRIGMSGVFCGSIRL
jgi:hypothetical protein